MYNPEGYDALLKKIKAEGYKFLSFEESPQESGQRVLYLRHDVDYSMEWAVEMARVNHENGIQGSFGFQLRSPLYNLLSRENIARVNKIADYGQHIMLHYTFGKNIPDLEELKKDIKKDWLLLKNICDTTLPVVSFHNPSIFENFFEKILTFEIPGFVNTYNTYFMKEALYRSDSNMRNSYEQLVQDITSHQGAFHLLCHPFIWWSYGIDKNNALCDATLQVIREKEHEIFPNPIYHGQFPEGVLYKINQDKWKQFLEDSK